MSENNEKTEKMQNYLRKEIIDKGYSPEDFANYLKKIKGENGTDLNLWSIEELYYVVPQFQESQEHQKQNNKNNFSKYEENIEQDTDYLGEEDGDLWGNKMPKKNANKKINCIINCKKLEKSELVTNRDKMKIILTNAEIKKEGLFSSSYYEIAIKNEYLNIEIKRKMNDLIWLKKKLTSFYPNLFIPPLPKLKIKKDEKYTKKKIYYLQCFIDYIINNDILLSSKIFNDFISLPDSEFQNSKQAYDKTEPPKGLNDMITIDGTFDIAIIPDIDKKAYIIKTEIQKKTELFNKLNVCLKETINQMLIMKQKLNQLSSIFEELSKLYSKSEIVINDNMNKNFIKLKDLFNKYDEEQNNKIKYFEIEIRRFFKYMKYEVNEFEYLYKIYDEARTTFVDVTDKKKIVFDDNFKGLKKYFGFTLNSVFKEYQNLHQAQYIRMNNHFNDIPKFFGI